MRVLPPLGLSIVTRPPSSLTCCSTFDAAAEEVVVADAQPEGLTLPEPAAGGDDGDGTVAARQGVDDGRT